MFEMIPNDKIALVENLLNSELSYRKIAIETGVSIATVSRVKQGKILSNRKPKMSVGIDKDDYENVLRDKQFLEGECQKLNTICDKNVDEIQQLKNENDNLKRQISDLKSKMVLDLNTAEFNQENFNKINGTEFGKKYHGYYSGKMRKLEVQLKEQSDKIKNNKGGINKMGSFD